MKLRHFVSGSAIILAGWLVATFVRDVPSQRYPKLNKQPSSAVSQTKKPAEALVSLPKSEQLPVSASR